MNRNHRETSASRIAEQEENNCPSLSRFEQKLPFKAVAFHLLRSIVDSWPSRKSNLGARSLPISQVGVTSIPFSLWLFHSCQVMCNIEMLLTVRVTLHPSFYYAKLLKRYFLYTLDQSRPEEKYGWLIFIFQVKMIFFYNSVMIVLYIIAQVSTVLIVWFLFFGWTL